MDSPLISKRRRLSAVEEKQYSNLALLEAIHPQNEMVRFNSNNFHFEDDHLPNVLDLSTPEFQFVESNELDAYAPPQISQKFEEFYQFFGGTKFEEADLQRVYNAKSPAALLVCLPMICFHHESNLKIVRHLIKLIVSLRNRSGPTLSFSRTSPLPLRSPASILNWWLPL